MKHFASREERRVHGKTWIFRGGPHEDDGPVFHVRQKGILLSFVEPMNLVDEHDGALALEGQAVARRRDDLTKLCDAREDGAKRDEMGSRRASDDPRERRLSATGRTPENDGADAIARDGLGQQRMRPEKVPLTDEIGQRAGTHAIRERGAPLRALSRGGAEESSAGVWRGAASAGRHGPNVARIQERPPRLRRMRFVAGGRACSAGNAVVLS